ncbi:MULTISPECIES: ABC transporter ATP-binding protein [unclassified Methanoregula]|uniref:ABC transporter ATP-binding protein n=1 Tax=unclassified Methanoregula TaxID=2649730 RepID=UPI0009C5E9D6|nr:MULTISPECIES: ABC transporter ATP-binding protein [unclassified Methanoregula]OPX61696.1 MAG: putative branched-chain amino acid transport ATP-binding protein LivG [Methanoregula sp. PtaB.Bin085]OPY33995.1 MAG: putative branched-chain amino acid transport ATP-binding protein LivG [Methanoregula sp. PtaU1.Bin006]
MLHIEHLHVNIGDKEVLRDINLHINEGETHVLLGPNGSGKTTLLMTIMGFSTYTITKGTITFKGEDVTRMHSNERAKRGMGMLFQRPPTISGLKLGKMLSAISKTKQENIPELAKTVHMDRFLERDINKGFSGGEIKRSEVLQLMIQNPDFIMLDEPESGVDLENISLIGTNIGALLEKDKHLAKRKKCGLVITHTGYILDYLDADKGHVMCEGQIRCHGNPREILKDIKQRGYRECMECRNQ